MTEQGGRAEAVAERIAVNWGVLELVDELGLARAAEIIDAERDAAVREAVGPLAPLLTQVAEFLADKDGGGPLYSAWEQGDIGNFDDRELTFEETIDAILDERDVLTGIVNVPAVKVYREVVAAIDRLAALAAAPGEPSGG